MNKVVGSLLKLYTTIYSHETLLLIDSNEDCYKLNILNIAFQEVPSTKKSDIYSIQLPVFYSSIM